MPVCVCAKTWSPSGLHRHHTARPAPTNHSSHMLAHTNTPQSTCMASLGNAFSFGRIYDGKQRVMKPREIFTISVRAYYPRKENGVNKKYLLKTGCCLTSEREGGGMKQSPFCVTRVLKISNSEVSVEASNISEAGINKQFKENA